MNKTSLKYMTVDTLLEEHAKVSAHFLTLLMSIEPAKWMEEKGGFWELLKPLYLSCMLVWNTVVHIGRLLLPIPIVLFTVLFNISKIFFRILVVLMKALVSVVEDLIPTVWAWTLFSLRIAKESIQPSQWAVGFIAVSTTLTGSLLLGFLFNEIMVGVGLFFALGFLAIAWANAEVISIRKRIETPKDGDEPVVFTRENIFGNLGLGFTNVKLLSGLFSVTIGFAVVNIILDSLGAVPFLGQAVLGLTLGPATILSSVLGMFFVVMIVGVMLLPPVTAYKETTSMTSREKIQFIFAEMWMSVRSSFIIRIFANLGVGLSVSLIALPLVILSGLGIGSKMALFQIANGITEGDSMTNLMSIQTRFMGMGDYFSEAFIGAFFICFSIGIIAAALLSPFISFFATFEHTVYRFVNHQPHKQDENLLSLYHNDPRLDFDLVSYFKSFMSSGESEQYKTEFATNEEQESHVESPSAPKVEQSNTNDGSYEESESEVDSSNNTERNQQGEDVDQVDAGDTDVEK